MATDTTNDVTVSMMRLGGEGPDIDDAPFCKACGNRIAPPRRPGFARMLTNGNSKDEHVCGDCLVATVVATVGKT